MNINASLDAWFFKVFLLLLVGALLSIAEWLIHRYLLPRFQRKQSTWKSVFLITLHRPYQIYVWFLIISFIVSSFLSLLSSYAYLVNDVRVIRLVVSLLFLLWFVLRFLSRVEGELASQAKAGIGRINDPTNVHAIAQLLRIAFIVIFALMVLQTAGIKMSGVLTFSGVLAAVFGFAAKDLLSNILGGFIIYWDRPFSVGDWIRSPDRNIEGTVEHIGWRVTRIATFDRRPLYVPNGILTTIALENPSRMTHRRFKIIVGVRYDDLARIVPIVQAISTMLQKHPDLDQTQRISVSLDQLSPSSLDILIYAFTQETQWVNFYPVRQDILLKVMAIVQEHGAECAFPTQTVQIPDGIFFAENSTLSKGDSKNEK